MARAGCSAVRWLLAAGLACLAAGTGCSRTPAQTAAQAGMAEYLVTGSPFRHVVFHKEGESTARALHIYIEGDGRPWVDGWRPAPDPTPRRPLALHMMMADPAEAIYLGRPCYMGLSGDAGCSASMWTSGRYSREVVTSMTTVADEIVKRGHYRMVRLIGYSGGGVLALLMAPELARVDGVLTVAANLDTEAWTTHHGYHPLSKSINPALAPELPLRAVPHIQLVGGTDSRVPAAVTESYRVRKKTLEVWEYPDYDHVCCWVAAWPAVLARFDDRLAAHSAGFPEPASGERPR